MRNRGIASFLVVFVSISFPAWADEMPWIRVSDDKTGFVCGETAARFVPWGVNYDHDDKGRLLEDYWVDEWKAVESHFEAIRDLQANVVRIHLQFGKFMNGPKEPNQTSLKQLGRLVSLAERTNLYLDLTGLGCYHKQDVPAWYDDLSEDARWEAQSEFWKAIANQCKNSPAIFCYDLMNEPVVPGGQMKDRDWLGAAFAGKHFVQFVTLDQRERPRPEIGRAWLRKLTDAIRRVDRRHLITVGLVDWSLDKPGLTSGFVPTMVAEHVDFVCVHLYPKTGKTAEALETLAGFAVGKPVVIEETFPLWCSMDEMTTFLQDSRKSACGWISFYWGKPMEELRKSTELGDAILLKWLERFQELAPG